MLPVRICAGGAGLTSVPTATKVVSDPNTQWSRPNKGCHTERLLQAKAVQKSFFRNLLARSTTFGRCWCSRTSKCANPGGETPPNNLRFMAVA
jgi:hypothetical protein